MEEEEEDEDEEEEEDEDEEEDEEEGVSGTQVSPWFPFLAVSLRLVHE